VGAACGVHDDVGSPAGKRGFGGWLVLKIGSLCRDYFDVTAPRQPPRDRAAQEPTRTGDEDALHDGRNLAGSASKSRLAAS